MSRPMFECPSCGFNGSLEDYYEVDDYWEFDPDYFDMDDWGDWKRVDPSLEDSND